MRKRWLVAGAVLAVLAVGFARVWPEAKEIYAKKKLERETKNLETGVVRVELAGQRFDVPLRYMYGETVEKYHRWLTPKEGRTRVDYLALSVLLPDLRPYYPEDDARWKVWGHGDKLYVTIISSTRSVDWFADVRSRYSSGQIPGRITKKPDVHGLEHYSSPGGDTYFPAGDPVELKFSCAAPVTNCAVFVDSYYRHGVALRYHYAHQNLPQWKEIDNGLKAMFDRFLQPAQSGGGE